MPTPAQSQSRAYTPTLLNSRPSPLQNRRRRPPPSAPLSFRTIRPAAVHSSVRVPNNSNSPSLSSGAADAAAAAAAVAASVVNRDLHHQSHASTAAAAAAAAAAAVMNHVTVSDLSHGGVSSSQAKQAVAIAAAAAAQATVAQSMGGPSAAAMAENGSQEHPPAEDGAKKKPRKRKPRTGPANFICDVEGCGKAFRMQGDLQTHMRKHTGDEPFVCSFPNCGRRYKWRSSLSHHEGLHRKSKDLRVRRRVRKPSSNTASFSVPMSTPAQSSINATVPSNISPNNASTLPMQQVVDSKTNNHFQTHSPVASIGQNTPISVQHLNGMDNILSRGTAAIMPRPQTSFTMNTAYPPPSHSMHEQVPLHIGSGGLSMPILQHQASHGHVANNHLLQAHHLQGSFSHHNQPWHGHVSLDTLQQGQFLKKDHILHDHLAMHNTENNPLQQAVSLEKSPCALNTHEGLSDVQLPVATNPLSTSNAPVLGEPNLSPHVSDGLRLGLNTSDFHPSIESQEFQGTNDQSGVLGMASKPSPMIGAESTMLPQHQSDHRNEPEGNEYSPPVPELQTNQMLSDSAPRDLQQRGRLTNQPKDLAREDLSKSDLQEGMSQQPKDNVQTNTNSSVPVERSEGEPSDATQLKEQSINQANMKVVASETPKEFEATRQAKHTESKFESGDDTAKRGTNEKVNKEGVDAAPTSANSSTDPTSEHAS